MPYIYKITNDINNKIYIGKTLYTIEHRFKEHCKDSKKRQNEKRPLYSAMNKYGIEHFHIELIEECDESILSEREKFWIENFGSFKNGYNATKGGDGAHYLDYDLIVSTYKELKSCIDVAKKLNINEDTVVKVLQLRHEHIYTGQEVNRMKYGKCVNMYDLKENYLQSFASLSEAGQYLIDNHLTGCKLSTIRTHISEVCRDKRKTAAKFIWRLADVA